MTLDNYILIPVSRGSVYAKVDEEMRWIGESKWHLQTGYAYSSKYGAMHTIIMENVLRRTLVHSEIVDHINRDRLDNRISNLQVIAPSKNVNVTHRRTKRSDVINDLYQKMSEQGIVLVTPREASEIVGVTSERIYQLKPAIANDDRFTIVANPHHRLGTFIGIKGENLQKILCVWESKLRV